MTAWMDPEVAARDWWRALVESVRGQAWRTRVLLGQGSRGNSFLSTGSTNARPVELRRAA